MSTLTETYRQKLLKTLEFYLEYYNDEKIYADAKYHSDRIYEKLSQNTLFESLPPNRENKENLIKFLNERV